MTLKQYEKFLKNEVYEILQRVQNQCQSKSCRIAEPWDDAGSQWPPEWVRKTWCSLFYL